MFQVKSVTSNQSDLHPRLDERVRKHLQHPFRRPPNPLQRELVQTWGTRLHARRDLILDAGCGKGRSSLWLAEHFPEHQILAVDKSAARLESLERRSRPDNLQLIRCNLVDFWLAAEREGWFFAQTYLLYPNPWPKADQGSRRWQMHPIFPTLLAVTDAIELRSNWELYGREFARALELATGQAGSLELLPQPQPEEALTAFEAKYARDGQSLYRLCWQAKQPS